MSQAPRTVTIGQHGRIVIPVSVRDELGLEIGAELVASVDSGRIILEPRDALIERIRARYRHLAGGAVEELLAERRLGAEGEASG